MQSGNDRRWYRCVDAALLRASVVPGETTLPPWPSPQCPDTASAAQWRAWLRLAWAGPRAAGAVEIASPVLARRIEAVIGGAVVDARRARRMALSLARYLLRAGSRATPYGVFAGVAPARFAATPEVRFGERHRVCARPDGQWLDTVVTVLESDPALLARLPVAANTLCRRRGGRLRVPAPAADGAAGPGEVCMHLTPAVALALAAATSPVPCGDLAGKLTARDISTVYRRLRGYGVTQRQIAALTGQSQPEVCEIIKGRQVMAYDVLVRIADGLGVPRGSMGLAYTADGGDSAYPGGDLSGVVAEVTDDVLRRDVLAKGSVALVGVPVLGKLLTSSAGPGELGLPSQVGMADVAEVKNTADQLRVAARARGGQARAVHAAAAQYGRLLQVPASEVVRTRLYSELAALNNLAGWCCFDSGMDLPARWHYRTAIDLAHQVGDGYELSRALRFSGVIDLVRGRPNDALKVFQIGQSLLSPKSDPELVSWLHAVSADALASMGHAKAIEELAKARGGWQSPDKYLHADMDYQTALVYMELRRPDKAEQLVATINGAGRHRPVGVFATVLRATIYVQAGEPRGPLMAKSAIDAVAPLHSVRAREGLQPLIVALEARPGSDHRDLAQLARKVAGAGHR